MEMVQIQGVGVRAHVAPFSGLAGLCKRAVRANHTHHLASVFTADDVEPCLRIHGGAVCLGGSVGAAAHDSGRPAALTLPYPLSF